ncbi:MFS transporter [Ravibacter arvi]|uniref:MFS transporter n=1 Tax=Ravibacter arvi TaxID=2051041 RepID=A0ABP8LL07_9BACT
MNFSLERVLKLPKNFITKERFHLHRDNSPIYKKSHQRIAVAVYFFCLGLSFASWASRIPDIKASLRLSEALLGTLLLALPAGQMLTLPFSGRIVARYGSKITLGIAFVFYAFSLTNLGLAKEAWQLALALFAMGVSGNLCNISVNTQAVSVEKLYGRSILASFHGVWSTAGFSGALIGLLMISLKLTPYQHFWIIALFGISATLIANRFMTESATTAPAAQAEAKPSFLSKPPKIILQLGLIGFCCMASEGTMFDWSGVYFQKIVKAEGELIPLGYASFMIMMAIGRFTGDKLQQRFGRQRMLQLNGLLISTGLAIAIFFPNIITATIGFIIVGFGVSSVVPIVYSTAGKLGNMAPSIALAGVSGISYLGFLLGPPLIGFVAELTDLRFSFGMISVLGLLIAIFVPRIQAFK